MISFSSRKCLKVFISHLTYINKSFADTDLYINQFRSTIGLHFSEKILLNKIIKSSIGNKYKHLASESLKREGLPDYYIRDGKYVFLFECKDNLIKKEVIESSDIDSFIQELKHVFIKNEKGRKKQLFNY